MPFDHKLSTKKLIPAHIRRAFKFREHLEVRFLDADRTFRGVTVLQHEEIPEEREFGTVQKSPFAKRGPQIEGTAHGFFGSVVKIVAEGWTNLGFGFDGCNQHPVTDDEQIPFFGGSEESRQLDRTIAEDKFTGDTGLDN